MKPKFLTCLVIICLIVCLYEIECKRSGGSRSRGSSSSGFWSRRKSSSSNKQTYSKPVDNPAPQQKYVKPAASPPKPSAPVQENVVKKEQSNLQQSSNVQRPIGWNVPGQNQPQNTYKTGNAPPVSNNQYPGQYPNTGSNQHYGTGNQYGHAAPPPYSGGPPPYNGPQHPYNGAPPPYNAPPPGYNAAPPAYNPHNQYPGYYQGQYNNMGHGGYGPPNGNKGGGFFGMGGHSYGGYGGYSPYDYGRKKSGGFLGQHAFRNILIGMFAWHMISGLTRTPYQVYSYYNKPEQQQIELPANILTLCNENATSLCAPGTTAVCTTNNTILCVATMTNAAPCPQDKATGLCINSTIPCLDENDPLCQNNTKGDNTTTINLPCFANVTVDVNLMNFDPTKNGTVSGNNKDYTYCVTTLAIPGPEIPLNATNECSPDANNPNCLPMNGSVPENINLDPSLSLPPMLNSTEKQT